MSGFGKLSSPAMVCIVFLFCIVAIIASSAQQQYSLTTLHSFNLTDGGSPLASLVKGTDGNFYGTTQTGGSHNGGTVFKITPSGTLTTLYNFCSVPPYCQDGIEPWGALVQGSDGSLYGTTINGGNSQNGGIVFKITPNGTFTVLYDFCSRPNCTDGFAPYAGLVQGRDGNFYGTTSGGGTGFPGNLISGGTVFAITPTGKLTTLYNFCSQPQCTDGAAPMGQLVQGSDENFYGTTEQGGIGKKYPICPDGSCGTAFKITPSGALTNLYRFCSQSSCADGAEPKAGLVQGTDGNLYGTTSVGGTSQEGTVFKISTAGSLTTLHSFGGPDGSIPIAPMMLGNDGNFYGTTVHGGLGPCDYGCGTIFKITPGGILSTLYLFCSLSGCTDGIYPQGDLVQSEQGELYGTTSKGGAYGAGTVFVMHASSPAIVINPTSGPPTTTVTVAGTGFDPYAMVDIYFDQSDLAFVLTDGYGRFAGGSVKNGPSITVPSPAVPGTHWITAAEPYGNKSAQQSFLVRTDWAQYHFRPDHLGVNPYENVLSPGNVGSLAFQWNYPTGSFVYSSPAVANGMVYIASEDHNLYAFNATTGALLWKYNTGYITDSSPAVVNGVVYIGDDGGYLSAINAMTGALIWKNHVGLEIFSSGPTVSNGVVYVGSLDSNVYAVDANTGTLLWTYTTGGNVWSCPAVANGVVYVGSGDHKVYALNANTGAPLWTYTTGATIYSSTPAVANGMVYVGSDDGNVYALNTGTGALVWKYTTGGIVRSSPASANGVVYIGSFDGNLYALNAYTGALLWKYVSGYSVWSGPAVANGVVYSGTGSLYALNASTGALLWSYEISGVASSPAVANGGVYVGSFDRNLYAFGLPSDLLSKDFSPPERPDPRVLVPDLSLQPSTALTIPSNSQQHTN